MEKLLGNQLTYMNEFYEVTAVSSDKKKLKEVADKLGVNHHAVEMTREITPLKDLRAMYQMYRFFRQSKPDIVHSHTPKAGFVGMIAAFFARVPIRLHTVAGLPLLEATGTKRKILSYVEAFTYAFCTKIYPNSAELKKIIIKENFCKESKLMVIGNGSSNGIDLSHFDRTEIPALLQAELREKLEIAADDFVFIFVGRMVKDKGVDELISAFKSLTDFSPHLGAVDSASSQASKREQRNSQSLEQDGVIVPSKNKLRNSSYNGSSVTGLAIRHRLGKVFHRKPPSSVPETFYSQPLNAEESTTQRVICQQVTRGPLKVKLLLVGPLEQDHNPILKITLSEIKNNPHIITTEYVPDVRPYLALSSCLVLPSYREGFPNAVLQAGAMGLPSIVTDINGCNEIIEHENNGLIIPVKDEKSLQEAMGRLLEDPILFSRLKNHTREKIVEKYCQKYIWSAMLAEYRRVEGAE